MASDRQAIRRQVMSQLQGKIAIVTGGGSGFGEGIVKLYAKEGAKVVIADINKEAADRVEAEVGAAALAVKADVSNRADIDNVVRVCQENRCGRWTRQCSTAC
ncbi:hypothetical protein G6F50_016163 [Rhizopus delemar]|uniref:Uncharacterized protein n=1 Tax=Rhizopus delemar TaxID=936053 RepID=A0A9P6XU62_9FUNG|nr:hypothetical protein G6F50_016163 [Rhizopus delemar]